MSYIDLNWDFSQFDRDNFNRAQASAYIANANAIAARVLASPNANLGLGDLNAADVEVGLASAAIAAHDYRGGYDHARQAYLAVRSAATKARVTVPASNNGWTVLPALKGKPVHKPEYAHIDRYAPGLKRASD